MLASLDTIPWKGSENQLLTLLAIGTLVGYGLYILIAKKDTLKNPRKSLWY
tara:strand:- start:511 stop:663 length:153 start_codon:yes stop_codon:yes gene_type:complete